MDTKQTHTPKQKLDDPTLVWDVPMTSAQARHYWMTSGFVAAELYEVAKRQAKAAPALLAALKDLIHGRYFDADGDCVFCGENEDEAGNGHDSACPLIAARAAIDKAQPTPE